MSIYKVSLSGRKAYWSPEHCQSVFGTVLSLKNIDLDIPGPVSISLSPTSSHSNHFQQFRKMMRRFKALKRTSIAKSTPSLNELDFSSDVRQIPSSVSTNYSFGYGQNHDQQQHQQSDEDGSSVLDGMIDLSVSLPDGRQVRMPIHARTPMMDVLVQVATENGINAGGMALKVPIDRPPGYLHYKPNMAIGKLGCTSVQVVPKSSLVADRPRKSQTPSTNNLPFEPTIRIQIDLPKNQKTVLRVSPQLTLGEILDRICRETNLEPVSAYELRAAKSSGFPLCLNRRLSEVGIVDFAIVASGSSICKSTSDILGAISKMSHEEKEKRKTRRFFGLLRRKAPKPAPSVQDIPRSVLVHGQPTAAVEAAAHLRTSQKMEKSSTAAKNRPVSMPPSFFDNVSDEESSATEMSSSRRDVASKPKKRQAPLPPPVIPPPTTTLDGSPPPITREKHAANSSSSSVATKGVVGRSQQQQHARRGSDSSSGYHGSSQPSPNPPAIGDVSGGATTIASRDASGSEKSSYSYKSRTSGGDGSIVVQTSATAVKEDEVPADPVAGQKKKTKAPLPPPSAAGVEVAPDTERPASVSPVGERSFAVKEDPAPPTDTRCSTPATAEDVDKNFQEVIQHIQNQISAEDDVTAGLADLAAKKEEKEKPASPQQSRSADQTSSTAPAIESASPPPSSVSTSADGSTIRPTHKPTNLDEPIAVSFAELHLSYQKDDKPEEEKKTAPRRVEQAPVVAPEVVPAQSSNGLLMIKPTDDDRDMDRAEPTDDVRTNFMSVNQKKELVKKEVDAAVVVAEEQSKEQAIDRRQHPEEAKASNIVKKEEPKTPIGGAKSANVVTMERRNAQLESGDVSTPISARSTLEKAEKRAAVSSLVFKTNAVESSEADLSLSPSAAASQMSSLPRWPPPPASVNRSESSSPRPSIVYNDPKKDLYPSMTVKSFEDEYYTNRRGAVVNDYVKAFKYGMVGEFSTGKEEREKSKGVIEATVAKRAGIAAAPTTTSTTPGTLEKQTNKPSTGTTTKSTLDRKSSAIRDHNGNSSVATPSSTVAASHSSVDELNLQLQREYEKLQAMFADWQFRLKQQESIATSGRKTMPDQELAFQRLQDEMMNQHRYVQSLCSQVQLLEKESSPSSAAAIASTAGPIAARLKSLRGDTNAAMSLHGGSKLQADASMGELHSSSLKKTSVANANGNSTPTGRTGGSLIYQSGKTSVVSSTPTVQMTATRQPAQQAVIDSSAKPSAYSSAKRSTDDTKAPAQIISSSHHHHQQTPTSTKWSVPSSNGNSIDRRAQHQQAADVQPGSMYKRFNTPAIASSILPAQPSGVQQGDRSEISNTPSSHKEPATIYSSVPPTTAAPAPAPAPPAPPPPPPPPPPPAPIMPQEASKPSSVSSPLTSSLKPVSGSRVKAVSPKPAQVNGNGGDPRGDLMASIRSFGGGSGLRKVSTNTSSG